MCSLCSHSVHYFITVLLRLSLPALYFFAYCINAKASVVILVTRIKSRMLFSFNIQDACFVALTAMFAAMYVTRSLCKFFYYFPVYFD